MKLRLAWLADPDDADSYSARETRVLLRAIARLQDIVPLWFAVGSSEAPHLWNGVRVFPLPQESLESSDFLRCLVGQQRPHILISNLPMARFQSGFDYLASAGLIWINRINPEDATTELNYARNNKASPRASLVLVGEEGFSSKDGGVSFLPYLSGLCETVVNGDEPTTVLRRLEGIIRELYKEGPSTPAHIVMRQQLFCNLSVAHVMFELTNALLELHIPTVAQDEPLILARSHTHREEDLFRIGAPEKYERVARSVHQKYDPENAITVHFALFKPAGYSRLGIFPTLGKREVLFTTGNHTVERDTLRQLTNAFEMILAPSEHVLRPYIEAGLSRSRGAVIPHGVDPSIFSPQASPFKYSTRSKYIFLQTSFPWIYEKGFDLTIKAFGRAFTSQDDVALVLRIPRIINSFERGQHLERLKALVEEQISKPGAPEIVLLEMDVELQRRGGIYTGADCYLFPLRAEGFAMTILEAMACGLPVIATPWSGPADFLSPRYAYFLRHSNPIPERARNGSVLRYHVEPDIGHLMDLMRHVYEHRSEGKAMGRLAADVARNHWTWRHAAAKLASIFYLPPLNGHGNGTDGFACSTQHSVVCTS